MQHIKVKADALTLLGSPMPHEDLTDLILAGLGDEYKPLIEGVHSRDTPISFTELHEKLINRELSLAAAIPPSQSFPITANHVQHRSNNGSHNNKNNTGHNSYFHQHGYDQRVSRPYLGKCQACGMQGHSVKRCLHYRIMSNQQPSTPQQ
ncbi:PREDICTED: uncharacterized protein LOC104778577 [Camelina sativa]|uniref:Uncharacterized protein LOC104778577 n=1 Tax=Camelina sativa TaxID=90675 RepID=A0ABM0YID5_CAMSA|nr:PREDICTED: uncharacterized protein LOC104778577 [Camelina sativa]